MSAALFAQQLIGLEVEFYEQAIDIESGTPRPRVRGRIIGVGFEDGGFSFLVTMPAPDSRIITIGNADIRICDPPKIQAPPGMSIQQQIERQRKKGR